ncbi:MAG: hypothetical protein LBF93_03560 [Zoogloeaceae bacterium]|jgi:hypothetical protein|nr:hypothetical protein [Zoogloeaceae bacterium]
MAFSTQDMIVIERAIATGELSVRFADRLVQYRSMAELLKARDVILAELQAAALNAKKSRLSRLFHAGNGF